MIEKKENILKPNLEIRSVFELRVNQENIEDRTISGTAIVFNSESQVMYDWDKRLFFTEIISPEAITEDLINRSNILMLLNHNDNQIPLARKKYGKGTLNVNITDIGLDFDFQAKRTALGDEMLFGVRNGDIDTCSFAFIVAEDGDNLVKRSDGTWLRTISKIEELFDLSIVNYPAYQETSTRTSIRSIDKINAYEIEERKEIEEREQKKNEMIEYYNQLDKILYNIKN